MCIFFAIRSKVNGSQQFLAAFKLTGVCCGHVCLCVVSVSKYMFRSDGECIMYVLYRFDFRYFQLVQFMFPIRFFSSLL